MKRRTILLNFSRRNESDLARISGAFHYYLGAQSVNVTGDLILTCSFISQSFKSNWNNTKYNWSPFTFSLNQPSFTFKTWPFHRVASANPSQSGIITCDFSGLQFEGGLNDNCRAPFLISFSLLSRCLEQCRCWWCLALWLGSVFNSRPLEDLNLLYTPNLSNFLN